jgi:hypothetical protein
MDHTYHFIIPFIRSTFAAFHQPSLSLPSSSMPNSKPTSSPPLRNFAHLQISKAVIRLHNVGLAIFISSCGPRPIPCPYVRTLSIFTYFLTPRACFMHHTGPQYLLFGVKTTCSKFVEPMEAVNVMEEVKIALWVGIEVCEVYHYALHMYVQQLPCQPRRNVKVPRVHLD